MKYGTVNSKNFLMSGYRIDPDIHLSEGVTVRNMLHKLPYELTTVENCTSKVFLGNIFSRIFVKDSKHGVTYLAASDSVLSDIETGRYIANKQARELNYLMLSRDWILVTCSGTLGKVTYTTRTFENHIATHDLLRVIPNDNNVSKGTLYAFLASRFGYYQITQSQFGGVVKHINDSQLSDIIVPKLPVSLQIEVEGLIHESSMLREEATQMLKSAEILLKQKAGLRNLTTDDYDYFGQHSADQEVSCFTRNIRDIGSITINAFNHSKRIRELKASIPCVTKKLKEVLLEGRTFSTGSFPRIEVGEGSGIMLINQSDIFDINIKGKFISRRNVKTSNLVEYGEVLIAGVGTLGESESFCRTVFANEWLEGQLVSGEFIRIKTTKELPSGYLYAWLSTDYGFRFIRNTQAGTKLCRPIPKLLLEIPVPIIDSESIIEIDKLVREAHTKRYWANQKENLAITMVEQEIEKWNK